MIWPDLVDGATAALRPFFGDRPPELAAIDLHEVVFHRDGPGVTLRFDLSAPPGPPPPTWRGGEYNVVQISVELFGLERVSLEGWARDNVGDLRIARREGEAGLDFEFACAGARLRGACAWARIVKVSPYLTKR